MNGAEADTVGTWKLLCRRDQSLFSSIRKKLQKCTDGKRVFLQQRLRAGRLKASVWIPQAGLAQGSLECFASEPPGRDF